MSSDGAAKWNGNDNTNTESFEYFSQLSSSKSIFMILSYAVSKLGRFLSVLVLSLLFFKNNFP